MVGKDAFRKVLELPRPGRRQSDERLRKAALEREEIKADVAEVEPLLRAGCTHELDASPPLHQVVAHLIADRVEPGEDHLASPLQDTLRRKD